MLKRIILAIALSAATTLAFAAPKELKFVVQFAPGGTSDRVGRIFEQAINRVGKGEYVTVIEYKPGVGGAIGQSYVANQRKPNETVVFVAYNGLVNSPILTPEAAQYDIKRDFKLVGWVGTQTAIVTVSADGPIKNWNDFIAYSKTNSMPYGSSGVGSAGHIASAIIAGDNPNFVHIPYKTTAIPDLLGKRLVFITEASGLVDPQIKDNKLTPIAVYAPRRDPLYPKVPTLKELKVNDREIYRWAVLATNRTSNPDDVIFLQKVLKDPELKRDLVAFGFDVTPHPGNPNEFLDQESRKFKAAYYDLKMDKQ